MEAIDYSRKWYVMAAVGMGIFLSTIDGSIVNIALPTLIRELNTTFATVQWVVLAYLLTLTTLLLGAGRLADMLGKKPIYLAGFIIFTMGSILCGLAPTVGFLIGFRVLQAVGAAMILALGPAIVTEAFPTAERGKALGITGAVVSIGIVVGPTLGGLILQSFSWHWIFFVNLPIGLLGIWMVTHYVPSLKPKGGQQFDLPGALTLLVGLLALLLGLTWGQNTGFTNPIILGLYALSLTGFVAFFIIERRQSQPMVDLTLFHNPILTTSLLTGFLTFIAIAGTTLLMPFYLENVLGYEPQQVGLLLAVVPISLGITAPISGALSDRYGSKIITLIGLAMLTLGYSLLSTLTTTTSAAGYMLRYFPIGVGMGIFQSPNNSNIMGSAPRERLGVVSGMLAITRSLGQTTGIALLGAAWAARVFFYNGSTPAAGATSASPQAQVAGMHDIFIGLAALIGLAILISLWEWIHPQAKQSELIESPANQ